tara:strand:+ start:549 stop:764 length:216 start_codon:yes stop_codon:yes gene_type:complete
MSKVSNWRKEKKNSPKEFKRKSNKVEKEAIRELKKDTATVQGEMQKERAWRKKAASRTTFKVGDKGVRDEV